MSIGIIGAGISGLTLAHALQEQGVEYHLWEATNRAGGYIGSTRETGPDGQSYLRELGPNSLLGDSALLRWIDSLGLTPELVFSNDVSKHRFIYRNGQYRQLPGTPPALLFGPFFSLRTKLAAARELWNKTTSPPGETLGQFFRRRFTPEVVDYALGPFVAGIYAGDPERLLVAETFPSLLTYERDYGSVLRGLIKNQGKTERKQSFSFRNGMQMLTDALAASLTGLSLNDPVSRVERLPDGWLVTTPSGSTRVDQLVVATSTDVAAQLLADLAPALSDALVQINYPPMTAVHTAYKRADVRHPLDGFGGLNPKVESRFSAGHIWSSSVFAGRCPDDEVLFTTFVGGQQSVDNARLGDDIIRQRVHQELVDGFGIQAQAPVWQSVFRWEKAIPQYDARLAAVRQQVDALDLPNLSICANWYGGVSLSDCIGKARSLATALAAKPLVKKF
ncbi:protoporphyrinogen oxidase [Spirosoma rhododendri]|uniref:Coproporphyrinogen III oxidase n=1 Tax=Spirosoma rhododendri TaxID=2728024 RepID=A0A7L5DR83_9BACT|nr:protoporphyrinogen oxidase [Spirosoma rhododendri]QJD78170.1 protoporphyrinogen oxidase [Spirosoma rhododendri]